jgi:hypothetical protein
MKRLCILATIVLLSAGAAACDDNDSGTVTSPSPGPSASTTTFQVALSSQNEVPPISNVESGMAGNVTIVLKTTRDANNAITAATADLNWTVSGMTSTTTLTASHIHRAPAGTNGGIVVNSGMSSQTTPSFAATGVTVPNDIAQAILTTPQEFYFNIHTQLNPGGVIRGQLR